MTAGAVCRAVAILIVVIGAIDPSISLARQARPIVSVVQTSGPAAFGDEVASALSKHADVVRGFAPGSSAVVLAGDRLPDVATSINVPAFVVMPLGASVTIDGLDAPARAHLDARATVTASLHVIGGRGGKVAVDVSADGIALDHTDRDVRDDDTRIVVPLTFVPAAAGPARLRVAAHLGGAQTSAETITAVDARPWSIFVFDPRPSWMSTFVRRALEDDERFAVTNRTVTSRSVATDTPNAPVNVASLEGLLPFDAIVVGAPDALTPADVAGLTAFMRRRGGAVVLLWDVRPTGPALALTGVDRWSADTRAADRPIALPGGTIRASDVSWPARMPERARVLGRIEDTTGAAPPASGEASAVVWATPVGSGALIVSGALDSWRYRILAQTAFDAAWRTVIASAAEASPAPITLSVTPAVARPGERIAVDVHLRDVENAAGPPPASSLSLRVEAAAGKPAAAAVRAWPGVGPGRFATEFEAPATPGSYRLIASDGSNAQAASFVVGVTASAAGAGDRDLLSAWATSRGGRLATIDDVGEAIRSLGSPESSPAPWHPMRSGWWILPVTLLTGIDWWTRRRRGLK